MMMRRVDGDDVRGPRGRQGLVGRHEDVQGAARSIPPIHQSIERGQHTAHEESRASVMAWSDYALRYNRTIGYSARSEPSRVRTIEGACMLGQRG